ncbi:hypothetical protein KSF_086140 [Reticulibacter mediterranei]|uniref:Uncharacterized protein n=1 Tax=Reticulibacter mediterranei TaxID=2778369 RepID=A0A8J3IYV6_9CHLR|nr:hypothetical protein [Reticulibacter mediterranei]GHO98566.1 hypothetical protein KSF_086140 [Reticulibacter mediterranei]
METYVFRRVQAAPLSIAHRLQAAWYQAVRAVKDTCLCREFWRLLLVALIQTVITHLFHW